MRGFAALALVAGFSSCVKDVDGISPAEEAEKEKENAELQLGLNIPDGQSWGMSAQISANVTVNLKGGEKYTVTVYSNDPIADGKGVFLTKGTVDNGGTFKASFTGSKAAKSYIVGATDSKGVTRFTTGKIENGVLYAEFGGSGSGARSMRSITVGKDVYSEFNFPSDEELNAAFPTVIPSNADEVDNLETLYGSVGDLYAIYKNVITEGHNLKVTRTGEVTIGGNYQNTEWVVDHTVVHRYNVYVYAEGNLTINRLGAAHFNLYIMKGNITLPADFGEMSGTISVAKGATLNDLRNSIAANDGAKLFNRGTINATNSEKYDIGNNSTVYNEGIFIINGPMSYSPGAGNTSYFINKGDGNDETVDLKAPSMTLNSTCHFYTEGKVEIEGLTSVTQQGIVWINNGHYTTGSMKFSAHNGTFYNYCQLLVSGECGFTDGLFNMMTGSYAEFGKGLFNNFHVNMADNTTINIKNGTKFGQQGAGILQGFYAVDNNARAYVRLGGLTQVPAHKGAALHISGAKMTFAYEQMKFYEGVSFQQTFDNTSYWNETTQAALEAKGDERTTWERHDGAAYAQSNSIVITTPTDLECTGTIEEEKYNIYEEPQVYSYAFEDQKFNGDYDMNDVVLKVTFPVTKNDKKEIIKIDSTKLQITMVAAGATFKIKVYVGEGANKIALFDGQEIHKAFGVNDGVMVNTGNGKAQTATPVVDVIDIPAGIIDNEGNADFTQLDVWIHVNDHIAEGPNSSNQIIKYIEDKEKPAPYAIMVPQDWRWPKERICITEAYPGAETDEEGVYDTEFSFATWAETADGQRTDAMREWFKHPVIGKTMVNE